MHLFRRLPAAAPLCALLLLVQSCTRGASTRLESDAAPTGATGISTASSPSSSLSPASPLLSASSPTGDPAARQIEIPKSGYRYDVDVSPDMSTLRIDAAFAPGTAAALSVDADGRRYVKDVAVAENGKWRAVDPGDGTWTMASCPADGCRIRYRFLIEQAARGIGESGSAMARDGLWFASPACWLLRPMDAPATGRARIHATAPPGIRFVTGMSPAPDGAAETWELAISDLELPPYTAVGRFRIQQVSVPGATIQIAATPAELRLGPADFRRWVEDSARAILALYGRFPAPHLTVFVVSSSGDDVQFGITLGSGGASIILFLGRRATEEAIRTDWVLVHEITHLAFPSMSRRHRWLEEGLATYLEPIARIRSGTYRADQMWAHYMERMPAGLPGFGDRGLDRTHTWGRTYWGGAMFCLLADVRIRERTGNRYGLPDAMRGILEAGGNSAADWDVLQAFAVGDKAVGVPVLTGLYREMAEKPVDVDLEDLWRKLGLKLEGETVVYDDAASLASVRRAITARPAAATEGASK